MSQIATQFVIIIVASLTLIAGMLFYAIKMPGNSYVGELPAITPEQQELQQHLSDHVWFLAEEIGERNYSNMTVYNKAADYIEAQLKSFGYVPANQVFGDKQYRNIAVDLYGRERRNEIIVIGAHYDTTWMTPGADDNASGIAALLEIARTLKNRQFSRTVRFIAFANEEDPFYGKEDMGSRVSAKRSYDRHEDLVGMFSLEMVGYYSEQQRSQFYPRSIRKFYPEKGNFIAFVSNISSRKFLHHAINAFRVAQDFPSEGLAAPEWLVPDIRRSDNASYWYYGFPAMMITDTSNYRNWNYHNVGDVHRTLNYEYMARVVDGLCKMIEILAREE